MAITPSQHWLTATGTLPALYRGSVATHTAILRPIAITFTGEAEKMGTRRHRATPWWGKTGPQEACV